FANSYSNNAGAIFGHWLCCRAGLFIYRDNYFSVGNYFYEHDERARGLVAGGAFLLVFITGLVPGSSLQRNISKTVGKAQFKYAGFLFIVNCHMQVLVINGAPVAVSVKYIRNVKSYP